MQHNSQAFGKRKAQLKPSNLSTADILADQSEDDSNPALEGLVCEIQQAGLLTAVTLSWANASTDIKIAEKARTYSHYVPQDPVLASTLLNMTGSMDLSANTITSIDDFLHALSSARPGFLDMMKDAEEISLEHATIIHRKAITADWKNVADIGITALQALKGQIAGRLPSLYLEACSKLIQILQDARSGNTPCIDSAGEPLLPQLPQRRSSMRRSILENCNITIAGNTYNCMVNDISPGGVGLTRVPQVTAGKPVSIEMSTGRVFEGRIAWCRNSAAGVQFNEPLPPDDPLLSG